MLIRKIMCFLFVCFVLSHNVIAQPMRRITGQVLGQEEKQLASATVSLIDQSKKQVLITSADSSGRFELVYGAKGHYTLAITYTGYKVYNSELFQLSDKDFGRIKLVLLNGELEGVVVQAKPNLIELNSNSITYNVSKSIDAQGVSALEALKKAPGISVTGDNSILLNGKQGALILVDGKQTYLSGKEITDLLKSMPASEIKSIEIINSPSAKYDAAGSAGIINIKTNKSQIKGLSIIATTGVAYGITLKQNEDVSFSYRKNDFNLYGSYNHFLGNYNYVYGSNRLQNNKQYASTTDDTDKRNKLGARIGFDYNIDKKNTIGILLNSNFIFGGGITRTKTNIFPAGSTALEQKLAADNDYYFQQTNRYNVNINYKYDDGRGNILNIDADYGDFNKDNSNLQSNIYTNDQDHILSQNLYRVLNGIDIHLKAAKLDYTTNLAQGTLEAGAKYSDITSDNVSNFFHVLSIKDSLDDRRSNTFGFNEQITSGYVNYKREIGKWTLQGGLRVENSASRGSLLFKVQNTDSAQTIDRNYTNFFPSFSVSMKPKENHSFSLAYSRRIDRPAYQDLNPFVYLLDELSFWQGNPFLQPQLTHRASLQYAYKSATIISLTYSYTDQYSARITDTLDASKIVMIPRNLGVQKSTALSITQNITPVKWWDISFNANAFHNYNKVSFDKYRNLELKQLAARLNVQQRFKLPFALAGEVSGYFNTKRLTGANEIVKGMNWVDIALQRSFMNNKAIVRLAFNDIYKGQKYKSVQSFDGFYMESFGYYESRQIRLNFTYKFAESSVKGPRSRSSALENENGRIK